MRSTGNALTDTSELKTAMVTQWSPHVNTKTKIFATALFQSLHVVNPLPTIAFDNADRRKNIHCRQE